MMGIPSNGAGLLQPQEATRNPYLLTSKRLVMLPCALRTTM